MSNFLKKIPMPIVGVMLAFATLGNLVQSYGEIYRTILGTISALLFVVVTIKFASNFKGLLDDLNTPVGASVFPTYSMCIMLLATYIKPIHSGMAYIVWLLGILLHVLLMVRFTMQYVMKFNIKQVLPSWFIVYVGIAVASVTGKAFQPLIGQIAFGFALISYLVLLLIVGKRIFIIKEIPEPALPTLVIMSAPGSLCLAGYLNAFDTKNMGLFWFLLVVSQLLYLFAVIKLVNLLKLKFYPSYSGFTFPMAISALALKLSNGFFMKQGHSTGLLPFLVKAEVMIAILITFYVLFRYIHSIMKAKA